MIKIQELRTSNLVKVKGDAREYWTVWGIDAIHDRVYLDAPRDNFHDISKIQGIPITEEWLVRLGWQYYNGQNSGTLTKDFDGKLDVDFYEDKLQVKSHYEGEQLYRILYNIKCVHQLQNFYFDTSGQELILKQE